MKYQLALHGSLITLFEIWINLIYSLNGALMKQSIKNYSRGRFSLGAKHLRALHLHLFHHELLFINIISCFAGIMFNTGMGQHILKNPLVVNGIIEKVLTGSLRYSDSSAWRSFCDPSGGDWTRCAQSKPRWSCWCFFRLPWGRLTWFWRWDPVLVTWRWSCWRKPRRWENLYKFFPRRSRTLNVWRCIGGENPFSVNVFITLSWFACGFTSIQISNIIQQTKL